MRKGGHKTFKVSLDMQDATFTILHHIHKEGSKALDFYLMFLV